MIQRREAEVQAAQKKQYVKPAANVVAIATEATLGVAGPYLEFIDAASWSAGD